MSSEPAENRSGEPLELATLTPETFEPHMGSAFVMLLPNQPDVNLTLIKTIDEYRESNAQPDFRRPFSLVFEADDDSVYPQGIRQIRHPELGTLEVFITPFGVSEGKTQYNLAFC